MSKITKFKKAIVLFPRSLKIGLSFIILYLIIAFCFILTENIYFSTICAFISVFLSIFLGLLNIFKRDSIFGAVIGFLLSITCGILLGSEYMNHLNYFDKNLSFLRSENIGNILTILSLLISSIGYFKDLVIFYLHGVHIE